MERSRVLVLLSLVAGLAVVQCHAQIPDFVTLSGRSFYLNGDPYYPRVMNYGTEVIHTGSAPGANDLMVTAGREYDFSFGEFEYGTEAQLHSQLTAHFAKIRDMGFNAIRTGIPMYMWWDYEGGPRHFSINAQRKTTLATSYFDMDLPDFGNDFSIKHFTMVRNLIRWADEAGLKVILICGEDTGPIRDNAGNILQHALTLGTDAQAVSDYASYLKRLAEELRDEPGLLAYDLWNEPIWTDARLTTLTKQTVCDYTTTWYDAIRSSTDYHLITLGGSAFEEVNSWDPAVMKLDFYSPHIYTYPEKYMTYNVVESMSRFRAIAYWLAKSCPIPWLIGETGFAAEDDSIDPLDVHFNVTSPHLGPEEERHRMPYMMGTELQQAAFALETMDAVREYQGVGYSWWGFQNTRSANYASSVADYHHNFWGPLKSGNPAGLPQPAPWNVQNSWRDKLMVQEIRAYVLPETPEQLPAPPSNYYNWSDLTTPIHQTGQVLDQNNEPVSDALVSFQWEYRCRTDLSPFDFPDLQFWLRYASSLDGQYEVRPTPLISNYQTPIEYLVWENRVDGSGISHATIFAPGPVYVQRNLLPYTDSRDDVMVTYGEEETIAARMELVVTNGEVGYGTGGGRADLYAGHSVHVTGNFHAELGTEVHIFTKPVFPECAPIGSGMATQPRITDPPMAAKKNDQLHLQLAFELPKLRAEVFPNPANEQLHMRTSEPNFGYVVHDSQGRLVLQGRSMGTEHDLDITTLVNGVYEMNLSTISLTTRIKFTVIR